MKTRILLIGSLVLSFAGGFVAHALMPKTESRRPIVMARPDGSDLRLGLKEFISPLIDCHNTDTTTSAKNDALELEVRNYLKELKSQGRIEQVSLYYRDLSTSLDFGINDETKFVPASLLKVPIMISYLERAEEDPSTLTQRIVYDPKVHKPPEELTQMVQPPPPLTPGQAYEVQLLMQRMIMYSDNVATFMLLTHRTDLNIEQTLHKMNVFLDQRDNDTWISVRAYAAVFRILFNSTYLSKKLSNSALDLLTRVEFKDGLVAGLGEPIPVAHKFGERAYNGLFQLHDCGIIYFPNRPYLLCVMTRGNSLDDLKGAIAHISKTFYKAFKSEVPTK